MKKAEGRKMKESEGRTEEDEGKWRKEGRKEDKGRKMTIKGR